MADPGVRLPHVAIVGGGFGGLNAAQALARRPVRVTLVDRRNHHLFQPLLYQVATAALSPADIATPLRSILRDAPNVTVIMAAVERVDLAARRLTLDHGTLDYDALILAAGAGHSYYGHDDWERLAPSLKTLEDAIEIRRRILLAYERAEREPDGAERHALLTFVVVGGGPTGVELAGALGEISRQTVARDFRVIDPTQARIILLEGGPRMLPAFPESLAMKAQAALERIGVDVRTNALVTQITPDAVWLGGEQIRCRAVLWAAGVAGAAVARSLQRSPRSCRARPRRAGPVDPRSSRRLRRGRPRGLHTPDGTAAARCGSGRDSAGPRGGSQCPAASRRPAHAALSLP